MPGIPNPPAASGPMLITCHTISGEQGIRLGDLGLSELHLRE